ncbi:hypothetical protein BH10PSE17_BH10PSE17_18690 [soil metagenome]
MRIEEFWALIKAAREGAGEDVDLRPAELLDKLSPLPLEAIQKFQKHYEQQLRTANRWELWGAAAIMNGGSSDDGFRYFRDWLISEGQEVFIQAIADPDSLADLPEQDYFELEEYGYVALDLIESKGGTEIERDPSAESGEPAGQEWVEDDLPTLYPKLAAKYYE